MSNLKDIANMCGLSMNTVSRGLRGKGYVSADSMKKIVAAAKELGYRPNRAAQALKTRKSREIAILSSSSGELNMAKVQAIKHYFEQDDYVIRLYFESEFINGIQSDFGEMLTGIAGIILINCQNTEKYYHAACNNNIPCVNIPINQNKVVGDSICLDRRRGVFDAITYLIKQEHKSIYYVGKKMASCARLQGYNDALTQYSFQSKIILIEKAGADNAYNEAKKIAIDLVQHEESMPTAIQAYSDYIAAGLLAGFHTAGINVPEKVSVIGFDNRQLASMTSPRLTTLGQINTEIGTLAAEVLLNKINAPSPLQERTRLLPMKLIMRESA